MAIEFYSSIDLNKNDIQNVVIHKVSSAPSSPETGQMYYNSSNNELHFYDGSWQTVGTGSGGMTAFILEDDDGTEVSISDGEEVKFIGSGITTNWTDTSNGTDGDPFDLTFTIDAAQTSITSVLNASLVVGRDAHNQIDFSTDNEIHFKTNNETPVIKMKASGEIEATKFDGALEGNADTATVATTVTVTDNESTNEENLITFVAGAADSTGNHGLEMDGNLTYNPSTNGITAARFTGDLVGTANVATTVTITDNENTNEENAVVFTAGGDVDGGNLGLESDGDLTYNPSTGTLSSTIFKGNIDAVDGDFDGTLEADAITIGGTNILTGGIVTTLGTITQDTVTFTSANSTDPLVVIKNTTNDANGPRLQFASDKGAAGADNDSAGEIIFTADDDNQDQVDFATIKATVADASNGAEGGKLTLSVATHDAELQPGLVITDGDAEDEVDVTIGNGSGSVTTIAGDLTVTGTTTTVNSTTVNLNDHNIVLDSGNSTSAVINGAGITIEGGSGDDATFTYSTTGPKFELKLGSSYEDLQLDQLIAGSLDISGDADIDGTLEADAITVDGTALAEVIADTAGAMFSSNTETNITATYQDADNTIDLVVADAADDTKGVVELATAAEVLTGTDANRVVTADTLSAKSVVGIIDVSSLTGDKIVTIPHNLGTADVIVQMYDTVTEHTIYADIGRTDDNMTTASTNNVSIDFGVTDPPNDIRVIITSFAGASASGTVAYT